MALAILQFEGTEGDRHRFRVDIGKNQFYTYAIGDGDVQRINGVKILQNRKVTSPLIGPLSPSSLGRTVLEIPTAEFDRDHQHVQILSYRTEQLAGTAVSDIVRVWGGDSDLPALTFSWEKAMNARSIETVPFCYRESKQISSAMFLDALTSLIPTVLPMLGNLFGGGSPASGGSGGSPQVLQTLANPETIRLITQLIERFARSPAASAPAPTSGAHALGTAVLTRPTQYTQAMVAPALLAALPALMPVLQQLLRPETLNALNPALQGSEMNLRAQQQILDHLRQIMPQTVPVDMNPLLQGLSLNLAAAAPPQTYGTVKVVRLEFADRAPQMLTGRSRLLYRYDRDLAFPLAVETPRPIKRGMLYLSIRKPDDPAILIRQRYPIEQVTTGRLGVVPKLSVTELAPLACNEEYLVCAELVWKTKSGQKVGVKQSHLMTLMKEFCFDRVEDAGEVVALNDVEKFRDYWHKVWQDSFTDMLRRRFFDCKYYYTLERDRTTNARMETVTQAEQSGRRDESGRMKSGMILSPYALNELLSRISSHPPLGEAELFALMSSDFSERFNHAARTKVKFTGKNGDSVALWVYPEFKLQQVVLKKAAQVNESGHVIELTEQTVHFPLPAIAHFIGVTTDR